MNWNEMKNKNSLRLSTIDRTTERRKKHHTHIHSPTVIYKHTPTESEQAQSKTTTTKIVNKIKQSHETSNVQV